MLLLVGACIGVIVGHSAYDLYWGHKTLDPLDAAMNELDRTDPGWRMQEIEMARAEVLDESNSATVVAEATTALPNVWWPPERVLRLADRPPEYLLDDQDSAALRSELNATARALEKARKLATLPCGRWPREQAPLRKAPTIENLLLLDVLAQSQAGDMQHALSSCSAMLNCARSFGDDPYWKSQMARMAGAISAVRAIEHVLAHGEATPEALLQLQNALTAEESFPRLGVALRGQRAAIHELFEAVERGDIRSADTWESTGVWLSPADGQSDRDIFRSYHPKMLASWTDAIQLAGLPAHERVSRMEGAQPLPQMHKLEEEERRTLGSLRCLIAAMAAERFRRQQGVFPRDLEQLVPEYLPVVPLDPEDGQPLRYQRETDRVVIYSAFGRLRKPPLWVSSDLDETSSNRSVAVRLFDVKSRRQPAAELLPPPTSDGFLFQQSR
jgi:hypothetical protein